MFINLSKFFNDKTKDVVFTQLKKGKKIEIGDIIIDHHFKIPMLTQDVVKKVKGETEVDIKVDSMVKAMIKIIGLDPEFPEKDEYIEFLKAFDADIAEKILKNGLYYASQKRYIEGLIHLRTAYEFLGDDINVLYNYGKVCDELIEFYDHDDDKKVLFKEEAENVFTYISEKYPDFADAYYFLGFYLAMDDRYNQAKEYFKIALKKGIDDNKRLKIIELIKDIDDKADFETGSQLILNERFQEGLEYLLPLEPDHKDWWNLLFFIGLAYRHLNEFEKAIDYFKRTLEYNNGHSETLNELGIACLSSGKFKQARKAYEEALKIKPGHPELLCNLGIVYLNEGKFDEAEETLKKAEKEAPNDDIIKAWLKKLEVLQKK